MKGAPSKKKMAFQFELWLPHVVSTRTDTFQNERAHVLLALPSGFSPIRKDIVNAEVIGGTTLLIDIKWPDTMFDVKEIFGHPRFCNQYDDGKHPKSTALQNSMENIKGAKGAFQSRLKIKLPGSNYEFTDCKISGHNQITYIEDSVFDDNGDPVAPKTTIFVLLDLMVKNNNNGLKFSARANYDDDLMVG